MLQAFPCSPLLVAPVFACASPRALSSHFLAVLLLSFLSLLATASELLLVRGPLSLSTERVFSSYFSFDQKPSVGDKQKPSVGDNMLPFVDLRDICIEG